MGGKVKTHASKPWQRFLKSLFATPRRALFTILFVLLILYSGIIKTLEKSFEQNVFYPALVGLFLLAILASVWRGGVKRK
jgi:hypothetical protein